MCEAFDLDGSVAEGDAFDAFDNAFADSRFLPKDGASDKKSIVEVGWVGGIVLSCNSAHIHTQTAFL